ncbi:MAG: LytR/AlgR family response regulator transcription factor [Mangrovibacterium sp.]
MENDRINTLVVDNDAGTRRLLYHYLQDIPDIQLAGEATCAQDALFSIMELRPQLVFMNPVIPGHSGIKLTEMLKKNRLSCHVIFISDDEKQVISAIKNNVYDFLLKPLKKEDVALAISRFREQQNSRPEKKLSRIFGELGSKQKLRLSSTNSHVLIDPEDIVYCEAEGSYTSIYLDNGNRELSNNYLGMIARNLPKPNFYRISRTYLINLNKLIRVNKPTSTCILQSGRKKIRLHGSRKQLKLLCETEFNR